MKKVTASEEIIVTTILQASCPICKAENIVTFDDYDTNETRTCEHYYSLDFTDDDKYVMNFKDVK